MLSSSSPKVWAVVAAFRRPHHLRDLLASLAPERPALAGVLLVNNGGDDETVAVAARTPVPVRVLSPGRNLGCGGGVAHALHAGLADTAATHFWHLDDDATVRPGALAVLLEALAAAHSDVAVPLIVNRDDRVCWFPGPLPHAGWRAIGRETVTPQLFRDRFGRSPLPWTWSPWTSLLATRRAIDCVGVPRDDYWFQGEDIEFTLRLSAQFRCVLAPEAVCVHHAVPGSVGRAAFLKKSAQLQNNAYTFTRLTHGRRASRYLPGNFWRFLREEGAGRTALAAAAAAFWQGAIRGRPAGTPGADGFRREWEKLRIQR